MNGKISPSMMCADITKLSEYLDTFEKEGIEFLHIDVMDGVFVPNIQLGVDYIKQLRTKTNIPLDIHLMITEPEKKLDWFDFQPGELVSVHYESTNNLPLALQKIKENGARPMVALSPNTPLTVLDGMFDLLDGVLIMTVHPGFAGQKLVAETLEKAEQLRKKMIALGRPDFIIEVDGNVSFENAVKMRAAGATLFVAGSSSVFCKDMSLSGSIQKLRESIV